MLSTDGGSIKLGIQAPRSVPVHRKEVYEEIVKENRAATAVKVAKTADMDLLKKLATTRD